MCLGMLSTSLSHCRWVTLCHSLHKYSSSSALFDGLWPSIFLLITFQRFLMGFRSGNWAGHDRVLIWWSFIHTFTDQVWHGAFSCWKKHSSELGNIVRAKGSKFSSHRPNGLSTRIPFDSQHQQTWFGQTEVKWHVLPYKEKLVWLC